MLIAHLADLHLGYSQFGLEEREEDVYATFNEAIEISIREEVKLVILAGDIFHTPRPNGKAVYNLANALKKLKEKDIPVCFVLGEHDLSRMRDVPLAFVFSNLGLARRLRLDQPFVVGDCAVYGADKERRGNIDVLVDQLHKLDNISTKEGMTGEQKKNILVLHQGLTDMNKFAGEINSTDLPKGFDYYAMGHYHDHIEKRYQDLGGALLVYPGSIELTPSEGIKEVEKGFVIVDMSGQEATTHWVTLASRRPQFSFKVDYDHLTKGIDDILSKASNYAKKPVVKVLIDGKQNIDPKVIAANLKRLNDSCIHYLWQPLDENLASSTALAYDERPADLDSELLRLAKDALGSEDVANLAVRDLLPPAAEGDPAAVLDIVWDLYRKKLAGTLDSISDIKSTVMASDGGAAAAGNDANYDGKKIDASKSKDKNDDDDNNNTKRIDVSKTDVLIAEINPEPAESKKKEEKR